jgi:hypothetical protein
MATKGLENRPVRSKFGPSVDGFGPAPYRIGPFGAGFGADPIQNRTASVHLGRNQVLP